MKYKNALSILFLISIITSVHAQNYDGWITTDSMLTRREDHAAIQLDDGNILVSGGNILAGGYTNLTEIFDVKKWKWSAATPMNKVRGLHNLVRLQNGSIIAIGGYSQITCEILSKDYSAWSFTDSLKTRRYRGHSITLMQDGNVLLTGGRYVFRQTAKDTIWKECELYNYLKKEWIVVKDLNVGRFNHSATLLKDGKVLVVGGTIQQNGWQLTNTCEIYNPKTNEWTFAESMKYPRSNHSATLLSNGKVLVIGGQQKIAELYDPATNKWITVGSVYLASGHNRTVTLKNEEYLLLVHDEDGYISNPGWELYSLKSFTSVYHESFSRSISDQVVVKINDISLLIAGGQEAVIGGGDLYFFPISLSIIFNIELTGIEDKNNNSPLPTNFKISCFPNPFNPTTNISFSLPQRSSVKLVVYDVLGREVTILANRIYEAGEYQVKFDAGNLPSGIYFSTLTTPQGTLSKKMLLLK